MITGLLSRLVAEIAQDLPAPRVLSLSAAAADAIGAGGPTRAIQLELPWEQEGAASVEDLISAAADPSLMVRC